LGLEDICGAGIGNNWKLYPDALYRSIIIKIPEITMIRAS